MTWEAAFSLASTLALLAWAVLILAPWRAFVLAGIRYGLIGALCVGYTALVMIHFFRGDGGFGSLQAVRTLFASDPALLAGWLHYLAFDLFVGAWIAERCDAAAISRFIQAPILFATFMFGPVGLLVGGALVIASPLPSIKTA